MDAVAWSPDGTRLASAGIDNSVRIWNPVTGEETFVLRGHSGMFHDVAWHPDGAQLAAAGSDGHVWLWDATRGFERDTTPRALPSIDRQVAAGAVRGDDRRWYAESYLRAGQPAKALALLQDAGQPELRTLAARAAARAAAGQGHAEPPPDDAVKAKLRRQALDLLRANLTTWRQLLESGRPRDQQAIGQALGRWRQDSDLASLRDPAALARLPADERQALTRLWADVDALETSQSLQSGAPPLLRTAALQAWFARDGDLADTCARALRFAGDTKDPVTAERTAKICSLRPADDSTHEAALVLARRAVALGKGHPYLVYFQMALGMAEYRRGHYADADAALLAASKLADGNDLVAITAAFYRAMSLFRQGQEDKARRLATDAAAKMRPLPANEMDPLAGGASADDLILWMAYKEARSLLLLTRKPRLPDALRGEDRPEHNAGGLALARVVRDRKNQSCAGPPGAAWPTRLPRTHPGPRRRAAAPEVPLDRDNL